MNRRHGSVPVCLVSGEVWPKVGGREFRRYDYRACHGKRCEESSKETMNMEQWHNEESTVTT